MCQESVRNRQEANTRQCVGDVGAKACPPRCIAAGYSPDKGKIEFASLAKIKTVLNNISSNKTNIEENQITRMEMWTERRRVCCQLERKEGIENYCGFNMLSHLLIPKPIP